MAVLPAIRLHRDEGLGIVTLARPETSNSVNRAFAESFKTIMTECHFDRTIRALLIRAEGGLFCAGGDIDAYAAAGPELHFLIRDLTADFHAGLSRLAHMRKPVVTAVQGATAGAGFALALSGDIVVASRNATFTLNYPAMGLSPDAGTTWILPRLIGLRRAQELTLLNVTLSAEEAYAMQLITRVVDGDRLEETAMDYARRLAAGPTKALGAARALLIDGFGRSYDEQLAAEARAMVEAAREADGQESIAALHGRRPGRAAAA